MTTAIAPDTALAARAGKYLTFELAGEEYGLEILKVHEIIGLLPVTRIPRAPAHIRGVINLRGKVIPIMDLRARFGIDGESALDAVSDGEPTTACIIVTQVAGVPLGVVVDRVSEVANIAGDQLEETPALGTGVETEFLLGLAKREGRVTLLLDIDKVLTSTEHAQLAGVAGESDARAA